LFALKSILVQKELKTQDFVKNMGRTMENPYEPQLQRVMYAWGVNNLPQLAVAIGIGENTVRNWHKRKRVPLEVIRQAANHSKRPIEWFLDDQKNLDQEANYSAKSPAPGYLEKSMSSPPPGYIEDANRVESNRKPWPQDYAEGNTQPYGIPVFDLGVSAGAGHGMQPGLQALDASIEVYFTPAYMRRHFGRSGNGFAMVYVKGDSMQPTLWDGDEIVVDTRVQRVDRDGIYVFMLRGDIKVKRMQVKLDGSLLVKSDNHAYETEQVGVGQADTFQVQGRLVWPRLR
jgi:Peptidase S24-like/Bacteriophage CI repressor helix-turn-helix domain